MNTLLARLTRILIRAVVTSISFTLIATAQVETASTTTQGIPMKEVTVERGEVIHVSGNDLFVKMENGEVRHFPNVPETARATVDGKELGIHDLKPGMKLERTITVTATPEIVTKVQTVTGKIWQVMPPSTVILTLESGENQQFTVPEGQKFTVNGEEKDILGLSKGMVISATKVTEMPETNVQRHSQVSGTMPSAAELASGLPIFIMRVDVTAPMPEDEGSPRPPQPTVLPQTASPLPLLAFGAVLLLASVALLKWNRR